jgi:hypothetical protein
MMANRGVAGDTEALADGSRALARMAAMRQVIGRRVTEVDVG